MQLKTTTMKALKCSVFIYCVFILKIKSSYGYEYANVTTVDRVPLQLREFKTEHPVPIGVQTTNAGAPVDIRDTITVNSEFFNSEHFVDHLMHFAGERIPERVVHAKGNGAFGYFEVTHDVSKYTSADVFNGIGKKTPVFGRFSTATQSLGGTELGREHKGLAVKMYTKEGNLDLLGIHYPVYDYRDPVDFPSFVRSTRPNQKTNIVDFTMNWDFASLKPDRLHALMWRQSDFGIPFGYRRMDIFPIHAYEMHNKEGERFIMKFNFRTELGIANLTTAEALAISSQDPNFFTRDVYNAIANNNFPSWRLDIDVMTLDDAKKLDYNPFDVTRLWKFGTFKTVTIGRLVMNQNSDNNFRDNEQSAFNPANLVPGIPGPVDYVFKGRKLAYRDTQNYRLGRNHNKIEINLPKHAITYSRDSVPPVRDNMKDVPKYYPNSFSGPVPYVDTGRPSEKILMLDKNAVDFEPVWYFYNYIVKEEGHKQRLAENISRTLVTADVEIVERTLKLLKWIDPDLGRRVANSYVVAIEKAEERAQLDTRTRYEPLARCMTLYAQNQLKDLFDKNNY